MQCFYPDHTTNVHDGPFTDLIGITAKIWFWYRAGTWNPCRICGRPNVLHPRETTMEGLVILCNGDRIHP